MTEQQQRDESRLTIDSGWLVDDLGRHTCAGGTPESGYAHERGCGLEPLMQISELVALFDVLTELGLPINRPDDLRKHVADAERRGRLQVVGEVRELADGYELGENVPVYRLHRLVEQHDPGAYA